jgi:hypothetical protein
MSQFIRRWPPDTPVLNILRRSHYFDEPPRNVRSINTATNAVRCASSCTPCCIVDPDIARNQTNGADFKAARASVVCFSAKTTHVLEAEPPRICVGSIKEPNEKFSTIGFPADVRPRRHTVIRELC